MDWDRNSEENKSSKVIYFVLRKTKTKITKLYWGVTPKVCSTDCSNVTVAKHKEKHKTKKKENLFKWSTDILLLDNSSICMS